MKNYDIPKKTSNKRHEKDVVLMKSHAVHMKGITVKGKIDGKYEDVSSLIKPNDAQGKTSIKSILCDIIVIVDNNKVVTDAIDTFHDCDNSSLKNVIGVIMNVGILTMEPCFVGLVIKYGIILGFNVILMMTTIF